MAQPESRTYTISGELHPQHWETLVKQLGGLGVHAEILRTEAEEGEDYPEVLLNKEDFYEFANIIQVSRYVAGKAWNALAKLYHYKDSREYYERFSWYDAQNYQFSPLVFRHVPAVSDDLSLYRVTGKMSGLELGSLEELLRLIDEGGEEGPVWTGIRKGLKNMVGPKTLQFLRDIAATKRQEVEQAKAE